MCDLAAKIDAVADRFEASWLAGDQPQLAEFVSDLTNAQNSDDQRPLIIELVRIDLEYRWRAWTATTCAQHPASDSTRSKETRAIPDRLLLEDYVQLFPELEPLECLPAELIADEYRVRHACGNRPQRAEFLRRFPGREGELTSVLEQVEQNLSKPNGSVAAIPDGVLRDYDLIDELGHGGMGVVYRARQRSVGRVVALKVIRPDRLIGLPLEVRQSAIDRFRNEARRTAQLEHDNIVTVYDVGEADGRPFYSMRFIEGPSLADLLANGPLENRRAAAYLLQVARGLEAAHAEQILHRDIKPRNVLIDTHNDRALLADFGLAKLVSGGQGETSTGEVLGSPPYMSPEQATDSSHVSFAADIYGAGATLYHVITGRPPFLAPTLTETLRQVVDVEPVAPRRVNRAIDIDLETICVKCLEKDPTRRYASATALAEDLERYLSRRPIHARPIGSLGRLIRWSRRKPAIAALSATALLLLVLVAVVATASYVVTSMALTRESAAHKKVLQQKQLTEQKRREAENLAAKLLVNEVAQLRHDRPLAWTWKGLDNLSMAIELSGAEPSDLPHLRSEATACLAGIDLRKVATFADGMNCYCTAFSPDNRFLAFAQFKAPAYIGTCHVIVVDLKSRQTTDYSYRGTIILRAPWGQDGGRVMAFSPDSRWLVLGTRSGNIYCWDRTTKQSDALHWLGHEGEILNLAFSPEGTSCYSSGDDGCLVRWDVTDNWKEATRYKSTGRIFFAVSPDGTHLVCSDDQLNQLDPRTLKRIKTHPIDAVGQIRFIDQGTILAAIRHGRIVLIDEQNSTIFRTIPDPRVESTVHQSFKRLNIAPNTLLAATCGTDKKLTLWNLATGHLVLSQLLAGQTQPNPVFSSDGRFLAAIGQKQVVLYETRCGQCLSAVAPEPYPIQAFCFLSERKQLACMAADPDTKHAALSVWNETGTRRIAQHRLSSDFADDIVFSICSHPRKPVLAFTSPHNTLGLWQLAPLQDPRYVEHVRGTGFLFSPMDACVWGIADETKVVSWNGPEFTIRTQWDNSLAKVLTGHAMVNALAVGNQAALVGSDTGWATKLDAKTGEARHNWTVNNSPISAVAISNDNQLAALGTHRGLVRVVNLSDNRQVADLEVHTDRVTSLAFAPNGTLLATGSRDGLVVLWNRTENNVSHLLTLQGPAVPIVGLDFTADGRTLAVAVEKKAALSLWHLDQLRQELTAMELGW